MSQIYNTKNHICQSLTLRSEAKVKRLRLLLKPLVKAMYISFFQEKALVVRRYCEKTSDPMLVRPIG